MARAQNSYMAGSTSPSSLIQTACFFDAAISAVFSATFSTAVGAAESFVMESVVAISAANVNAARIVKRKSIFVRIFISSMYKHLICRERFFVKKSTFL